MRPIANEQSFLRYPLNELLGKPAHVRILRVLSDDLTVPVSAPEAAERTGLTEAGARRALLRLTKTGFVLRVGTGRSQRFGLRQTDPVVDSLCRLFDAERDRFQGLMIALRDVLDGLAEVRVAWLEALPGAVGAPLYISVLTDAGSLPGLAAEVRRRILPLEQTFDTTIELQVFTNADAPPVDWPNATLVAGVPPVEEGRGPRRQPSHSDREERASRLSRAVAELLEHDASLITRASRHVERILADEPGAASHDLQEWKDILSSYSVERLKSFLVATTPRANRLRQSSPFFAALTPEERDRVVATLESR